MTLVQVLQTIILMAPNFCFMIFWFLAFKERQSDWGVAFFLGWLISGFTAVPLIAAKVLV